MAKISIILGLILATTAGTGWMSQRYWNAWGAPPNMIEAARKLAACPETIGDWQFVSKEEFTDRVEDILQAEAHVSSTYRNSKTGEEVSLMIVLGPAGPIASHDPTLCYPKVGYRQVRGPIPKPIETDSTSDAFWLASFQASQLGHPPLNVYYAWSNGADWKAPEWARYAFAGSRYLYKVQVASTSLMIEKDEEENACTSFLRAFCPVWHAQISHASS